MRKRLLLCLIEAGKKSIHAPNLTRIDKVVALARLHELPLPARGYDVMPCDRETPSRGRLPT